MILNNIDLININGGSMVLKFFITKVHNSRIIIKAKLLMLLLFY